MPELEVLIEGLVFPEQPRWHQDRLWFSDWGPPEVIAVDTEGNNEVMLEAPSFPCCVDWLPDGRLLIVSAREGRLLRREPDGAQVTHGDLSQASAPPAGNELVIDGRGNAYVNGGGFHLTAGEPFAPGVVTLVTHDGASRQVADGLAFPNGMLVTADNATLIVAESYAEKLTAFDIQQDGSLTNRCVWAELGDAVPDGICLDADNAVWVRRRAEQAVRSRARRRRSPADDRPRPRLLRLCARRSRPANVVHDGNRVERPRQHVRRATHRPSRDRWSAGTRRRLAVGDTLRDHWERHPPVDRSRRYRRTSSLRRRGSKRRRRSPGERTSRTIRPVVRSQPSRRLASAENASREKRTPAEKYEIGGASIVESRERVGARRDQRRQADRRQTHEQHRARLDTKCGCDRGAATEDTPRLTR
jgi:sugar lactone lactonase YvrE